MLRHWLSPLGLLALGGCTIHYYDDKTGAEHIYGIGHMVMKASAPKESHQAIVLGTDIIGLGLGKNYDGGYFGLGWDSRRRIEILNKDASVDLIWPNGNFLNVRIGSSLPQSTFKADSYGNP